MSRGYCKTTTRRTRSLNYRLLAAGVENERTTNSNLPKNFFKESNESEQMLVVLTDFGQSMARRLLQK